MKSDGEGPDGASPVIAIITSQSANDPSQCSGNTDPSDQEEQKAEGDLERCSNKIHEGKQHRDSSQFFRNMRVRSKGKRERARGLMGSDFLRILPRLAPEGKCKKRGFKEGGQLPNRSPFCLSERGREMR